MFIREQSLTSGLIRSVITSVTFQPNPGWRVTTVGYSIVLTYQWHLFVIFFLIVQFFQGSVGQTGSLWGAVKGRSGGACRQEHWRGGVAWDEKELKKYPYFSIRKEYLTLDLRSLQLNLKIIETDWRGGEQKTCLDPVSWHWHKNSTLQGKGKKKTEWIILTVK